MTTLFNPSADVDATVAALCELKRQRGIALAIDIGRAVVEGIYAGDLDALDARDRRCPSLRALAAHPRMPFSATALHHAIGIYHLTTRLPGVLDTELTMTHLRAVLPLPDEAQAQLLSRAVAEGWTTAQLSHAAHETAREGPSKGGRPRLPRVVKTLHRLRQLERDAAAWADLDEVAALSIEQRAALQAMIARLERRLRGVRLRLVEPEAAEPSMEPP